MHKFIVALTLVILAGCASGPKIRTDRDPAADFSRYRTYNFAPELGTDRAGYSTIITGHFKEAVSREMQALGYTQSANPDLLVNFFTSVRDRTRVQSTPMLVGFDYYRYRNGLYVAWPLYQDDVTAIQYQVGTASIDVVDAARKMLVWEGTAEGRLSRKAEKNPGPAISNMVSEVFERYPARAGSSSR